MSGFEDLGMNSRPSFELLVIYIVLTIPLEDATTLQALLLGWEVRMIMSAASSIV